MDYEMLIKDLIIGILPYFTGEVCELEKILRGFLSGYSVVKVNETLPSVGDGLVTKHLATEFMKDKLAQGCSDKTLKNYLLAIQKLYEYTKRDVNMLSKNDIVSYLNYYRFGNIKGEQKPNTVRNRYLQLSSFFSWMYQNKYIAENPFCSISTPKGNIPNKQIITSGELEKITIACENNRKGIKMARDLAIVFFLLESGVRVSELTNVKISDVDWNKKRVLIRRGKGGKSRITYFGEKSKERLLYYLSFRNYQDEDWLFVQYYRDKQLSKEGIENTIKEIGKYSNIPRLHPHLFRTTFATNLISKGVSVSIVKELMGHSNLNTLDSYVQLLEKDIVHSLETVY